MPRWLVLGGTGEGLALARQLGPLDIYSVAGLGRTPSDLRCQLKVGGYHGPEGLSAFLRQQQIAVLIDATHPYAAQISAHARAASQAAGVPLWAIRRPCWQPTAGDDWRMFDDWSQLMTLLAPFKRLLFTLGREPLQHLSEVPSQQHWWIRCLDPQPVQPAVTVLAARGPFTVEAERDLFARWDFDVLISKNSGGAATEAKLQVARERGCPVFMQQRPVLPRADREFASVSELLEQCR